MQSNACSTDGSEGPSSGGAAAPASEHGHAGALLDELERVLGRLRALPLDAETDQALAGSVQRLTQAERMLVAEQYRRIAAIDARSAHETVGARTTASMLATQSAITRGEARRRAETAVALDDLPETAARLAGGTLSVAQADTAARMLRDVATLALEEEDRAVTRAEVDRLVASQVDRGGSLSSRQLRQALDAWAEDTGLVSRSDREQRAWRRRQAWLADVPDHDGLHRLSGRLPAVAAAKLRAAFGSMLRKDSAADQRTTEQRCADALVRLAERALDAGELPETAAQRPHVLLITTADALHDRPDAGPSMLDGHGPVSSATARQICCDADVSRVTIDRNGWILDVGRRRRDPSRRQRDAVIARDQHCVGCGAAISRCEVHHIHWWGRGGRTDLSNLVLVCWDCHTHIHHHGWSVTRRADGTYTAQPPAQPPDRPPAQPLDRPPAQPPDRPPAQPLDEAIDEPLDRPPPEPDRHGRQPGTPPTKVPPDDDVPHRPAHPRQQPAPRRHRERQPA